MVLKSLAEIDYMHAYFPRSQFDDWHGMEQVDGTYLFGKKGDGYVSLYLGLGGTWESDFEWRVAEQKNVFVLELGTKKEYGSFGKFKQEIMAASLMIHALPGCGYNVTYDSPSVGLIKVSWDEGPMMVEGDAVDLGPYARYDNDFSQQEFGSSVTEIRYKRELLSLDFSSGESLMFE